MNNINIYTIGFTKKKAEYFFNELRKKGVRTIIDTRLNNMSQLAGFAKRDDLQYFLKEICSIDYVHMSELAPTKNILDAFKKEKGPWETYEKEFNSLIKRRKIDEKLSKDLANDSCLLCSEHKPHRCHRRLVAEYLQKCWGNVNIDHIE